LQKRSGTPERSIENVLLTSSVPQKCSASRNRSIKNVLLNFGVPSKRSAHKKRSMQNDLPEHQRSKCNVLVAYPYLNASLMRGLVDYKDEISFILDSGAFSAWKSGKNVTLDGYCKFVESLPFAPLFYFTLDVIGDPIATMRNYHEMRRRGFSPVPVFTPGAPIEHLEEYYETSEILGCGGLTNKVGQESLQYLQRIVRASKGRKMHLLGYTKPQLVKHFKPFSCDSSSWCRAQRYGHMDVYLGRGEYGQWNRPSAKHAPKPAIVQALRRMGFDVAPLMSEHHWRKSGMTQTVSTRSWCYYMRDAERAIRTKIFLAVGNLGHLNEIMSQWRFIHARSDA